MTKQIHIRSQKSLGSSSHRFGGPDRYIAVTIAPDGVTVPKVLRRDLLTSRGIKIVYCGEGYSKNTGPKSMYGRAMLQAKKMVE